MAQHSFFVTRSVLRRSIRRFIGDPADMNYAYALLLDPEFGILDGMVPHHPLYKTATSKVDPDTPDMATAMGGEH